MTDNESLDFSRLMAESSLGSQGARELISRSDPTEVSRVLQTARRIEAERRAVDARDAEDRDAEAQEACLDVRHDVAFTASATFGGDLTSPDNERSAAYVYFEPKVQTNEQDRLDREGASDCAWLSERFGDRTAYVASGITRSMLDYWTDAGVVEPSLTGPASQRYSFHDILRLKVTKRLLDSGISLHQARPVVSFLGECNLDVLPRITLISDGAWVRACITPDEVVDLLLGGQGVFGIAIGGVWREVVAKLSEASEEDSEKPAAGRLPEPMKGEGAAARRKRSLRRLEKLAKDLNDFYADDSDSPVKESPVADMSTSCSSRDGF